MSLAPTAHLLSSIPGKHVAPSPGPGSVFTLARGRRNDGQLPRRVPRGRGGGPMDVSGSEGQTAAGVRSWALATRATQVPEWHLVPGLAIPRITPGGSAPAQHCSPASFHRLCLSSGTMQADEDGAGLEHPHYRGDAPPPSSSTLSSFIGTHSGSAIVLNYPPKRDIMDGQRCIGKEYEAKTRLNKLPKVTPLRSNCWEDPSQSISLPSPAH